MTDDIPWTIMVGGRESVSWDNTSKYLKILYLFGNEGQSHLWASLFASAGGMGRLSRVMAASSLYLLIMSFIAVTYATGRSVDALKYFYSKNK